MSDPFYWEWWDGEPQERDAPFVTIKQWLGSVLLSAGHFDYEVWGEVELDPDTAETIAYNLIEAARAIRESRHD